MSTIVKAALRCMERIAPLRLAGSWDNVGLIIEAPYPSTSRRILLTIDLTPAVADEALALNPPPALIISYHPPIFAALKSLTLANPLQANLLRCAVRGTSVFSPHTSVDSAVGGVNDWLARAFGADATVQALRPTDGGAGAEGSTEGLGRLVTLAKPEPLDVLVEKVKKHLGLQHVQLGRSAAGRAEVGTIALCAGSGGSVLGGVPADLLWTGEMQHHEVLATVASGSHVLLCGHTHTERGYLKVLQERLQQELASEQGLGGEVEVLISSADRHPLDIV
ncbi:NGG1p interacting factor 3 [Auricularia subglabra TFB-10046 SS5]|uniref:NGG1p interacting factor 3 n=1 Tax=Auricularia subglabra (strain TFB-10046 / SS5) TaxID=717982 RepID=J0LJV7_AURST|nr:NGG1p interacting factor 3 [Auricularia subglabra TFB-10046 SS5]